MKDFGLLVLRLVTGGLLMGHGSQKLFGSFGGHGLEGTGQFFDSQGIRPGRFWAQAAGMAEFGGGLMTALGLFHPMGPITMMAPMAVAAGTVHGGKPIWVTSGGAELPVTNMAVGGALLLTGPGFFSADRILGTKMSLPWMLLMLGATYWGISRVFEMEQAEKPQERILARGREETRTAA